MTRWDMENRTRSRGLVGPLLLVIVGALLLLSNLGMLSLSAWELVFRFWPVLLIAVGLEILFGRRSVIGSLIVVVVVLAIIAGAIAFAPGIRPGSGQAVSESISQPLEGAKRAALDISYGAGTLRISSLPDDSGDILVQGTASAADGEQLVKSFQRSGDLASFRLGTRRAGSGPFLEGAPDRGDLDLRLNGQIPMTLKVDGGVGTANLDLSQLQVTNLDANLGVGSTTITMPAEGRVQANVNGGIGELTVVIPRGVGTRIQTDSGLGGLNVPPGYQKQDRVYTSPDYATAQNRLDLTVRGGVGRISVQQ